jgi:hypothetical protein
MLCFWTMLVHYHAQVCNGAEMDMLLFKNGWRAELQR